MEAIKEKNHVKKTKKNSAAHNHNCSTTHYFIEISVYKINGSRVKKLNS